jgi:exonuclease III
LAITANVAGLTGSKLLALLTAMHLQAAQLVVLTETRTADSPETLLAREPGAGALAGSWRLFHTPGTGNTGGVVIAVAADSELASFSVWSQLQSPQVLRLDGLLEGQPASIIGVYAPSPITQRGPFYASTLSHFLPEDRIIIAGGDWNVTLSDADIVGPDSVPEAPGWRAVGRLHLQQLMLTHQLKDVWREAAGSEGRDFTHWSSSAGSGARLDFWLVSEPLLASATSRIESPISCHYDHQPVSLSLQMAGPGLAYKGINAFPLLVFSVQPAFEKLKERVVSEAAKLMAAPTEGLVKEWSDAKERLRKAAHQLYAKHRSKGLREAKAASRAAAEAAGQLGSAASVAEAAQLLGAWRDAQAAASASWGRVLRPVKDAADLVDQEAGEAATYYFHSRARVRSPPVHVARLNRPGRQPVDPPDPADTASREGLERALQYAQEFYSSESPFGLFRPQAGISAEAQSTLLDSLPRRLSAEHAALAEGPGRDGCITEEELRLAISQANRGSAPGWDGLPYEFYRVFASELVPVLARVFNAAFGDTLNASPLAELLEGVICLLAKPGQSQEELSGYRPITLLNCDIKLVMSIHSGRLQLPLDYLIDIGQSAFLRERDISDNVRFHLHLAARIAELGLPGWLLLIDMSKAYDSVARPWLRSTMVRMGFREVGAVRWCRILLDGSSCRVRVNGAFTVAFPVESGLFQGSSLSCQEWVIALQPLVSYLGTLQAQGRIATLPLPSEEPAPAACAHADDTKSPSLQPDQDGPAIKEAFAVARAAGMPALNPSKSCLLPLFSGPAPPGSISLGGEDGGEQRHLPTGFRSLPPGHPPHRLLGIPFSVDAAACTESAYANLLPKVNAKIQAWKPQPLTAFGRAHVARQELASKLVYQANFTDPGERLKPVQLAISRFISRAGKPEEEQPFESQLFASQRVLSLAPSCGGLGAPNLQLSAASMRAKPVWKALRHSPHPAWQLFTHEVTAALPSPPDAPPGLHCLVTRPALSPAFPPHATSSARAAVEAFRQLKVERIVAPEQQDFHSIMLELTFPAEGEATGGRPRQGELATAAARSWLRLSKVREAGLRREQLSSEELADWELIVAALPAKWKEEVERVLAPVPEWACISPAEGARPAVFRGPDRGSSAEGPQRLWELWNSGILVPLSFPLVPGRARLQPAALVVWRPKPQSSWSEAEYAAAAAQSLLPADQRVGIRAPHLVGVWGSLGLDPRVFGVPACPGCAPCSLLDMTAGRARKALAHLQLSNAAAGSRLFVLGYQEEGALFPPAWRRAAEEEAVDLAALSLEALDLHGLRGQEEKWRKSAMELRQQWNGQDVALALPINQPPDWVLDPGAPAPPRPSPAERAAAREASQEEAAAAAGLGTQLPQGFRDAWQRQVDPTIQRSYRVTAWRLMHATLGCGAYLAHARTREARRVGTSAPALGVAEARARCKAPCCSPPPGAPPHSAPLETASHAFLTCPDVVEAIEWMRATWAALAGIDPGLVPSDAEVLLADNLGAWEEAPVGKPAQRLWTRLRVATLGAIWQARCERDANGLQPGTSLARHAATLALASVEKAIRRDWARAVDVAPSNLPSFCAAWFRGIDLAISLQAFEERWAEPGYFCEVHEEAGHQPTLEILLGGPLCPPLPA